MESTQAADRAMTGWLGALGRAGIFDQPPDADGATAVAQYVVGEVGLTQLRAWFDAASPEVRERERRAVVEVLLWMMHADGAMDPEEVALVSEIIGKSGLSDEVQDELVAESHEPPSLADIEERLTHPVLRELMLALAWELASADGSVARSERDFYTGLSKRLGVSPVRAAEIQRAIAERVG